MVGLFFRTSEVSTFSYGLWGDLHMGHLGGVTIKDFPGGGPRYQCLAKLANAGQ